jgi:formate/nitrite transporter
MSFKTPVELAKAACTASQAKSRWSVQQMLILGILAGAYIAFAGYLCTVVTQDMAKYMGVGFTKFMGGAVFSVGLMLVVIAGAELFTGNCMMPLGSLAGCTPMYGVVRNWFWVYIANFIGSVLIAILIYNSGLWRGPVGVNALKIAAGKMAMPMNEAFFRGILCNWIVVLAVWMSMAATDIIGKIFACFFPIMLFVASGFEHSIANMYFMSMGIFVKGSDAITTAANLAPEKLAAVTWGGFFHNLIPVTIGNMVGGILFVAVFYYLVYKEKLEKLD